MARDSRVLKAMTRIPLSLSCLLPAVLFAPVLLLFGLTVGWEVGVAAVAVILMTSAGVWCLRRRRFVAASVILSLLGLAAFWMLFVDFSWFVEGCQDCFLYQDVFQYRVFGIPVYEWTRPADATFARVAEDLGHPCPHRFERWHKTRWWGLIYRRWPNINGITRIGGGEREDGVATWYDDRAAAIVQAAGRASPGLGEEFFRRACLDQDWCYLCKFMDAIREKRLAEPDPPADLILVANSIPRDPALAAAAALRTADLAVAPDPAREPLAEYGMFDDPADLQLPCPKCKEPVTVEFHGFLKSNSDWERHVSRQEAERIAQVLALPRQTAWYAGAWASHGGGNAVIGVQDCPRCGCRCLIYLSYRLVSRERYSATLQGLARLPGP